MARQPTMPSCRLLDPSFRYTPAVATDIAARFRSIRKAQAQAERIERDSRQAVLDLEPFAAQPRTGIVLQLRPPKRKAPVRRAA